MRMYSQRDVDRLVSTVHEAYDTKAYLCGIIGFVLGIFALGFVQYGIANWAGW